jgi:hypothetical protein
MRFRFHCSFIEQNYFCTHFLMWLNFCSAFFAQDFAAVLSKFRLAGCDEIIMTFHFAFRCRNHVYSRIQNQLCVTRYPKFFSGFWLQGTFLPQFAHTGCNDFFTTFLVKKPTFQGMGRPCFGKWGSSN